MSDQRHPDHLSRSLDRFFERARKLDAATFTAAAGVNLRLYDNRQTELFDS